MSYDSTHHLYSVDDVIDAFNARISLVIGMVDDVHGTLLVSDEWTELTVLVSRDAEPTLFSMTFPDFRLHKALVRGNVVAFYEGEDPADVATIESALARLPRLRSGPSTIT